MFQKKELHILVQKALSKKEVAKFIATSNTEFLSSGIKRKFFRKFMRLSATEIRSAFRVHSDDQEFIEKLDDLKRQLKVLKKLDMPGITTGVNERIMRIESAPKISTKLASLAKDRLLDSAVLLRQLQEKHKPKQGLSTFSTAWFYPFTPLTILWGKIKQWWSDETGLIDGVAPAAVRAVTICYVTLYVYFALDSLFNPDNEQYSLPEQQSSSLAVDIMEKLANLLGLTQAAVWSDFFANSFLGTKILRFAQDQLDYLMTPTEKDPENKQTHCPSI